MAQSFWSKLFGSTSVDNEYTSYEGGALQPNKANGILLTIAGILLVGGLLFGVFNGARWAYNKIAGDNTTNTVSTIDSTNAPDVTVTSSTSTDTPQVATATPAAPVEVAVPASAATPALSTGTAPAKLPQTGPMDYTVVFVPILAIGYLAYRKKLLS
jgi:hypothetical protein